MHQKACHDSQSFPRRRLILAQPAIHRPTRRAGERDPHACAGGSAWPSWRPVPTATRPPWPRGAEAGGETDSTRTTHAGDRGRAGTRQRLAGAAPKRQKPSVANWLSWRGASWPRRTPSTSDRARCPAQDGRCYLQPVCQDPDVNLISCAACLPPPPATRSSGPEPALSYRSGHSLHAVVMVEPAVIRPSALKTLTGLSSPTAPARRLCGRRGQPT